jgi:TatD DNase family protein
MVKAVLPFPYFCPMILIDTHTHLYLEQFDNDRTQVVENAIKQGVKFMLLPNIDAASLGAMKELSQQFPENCLPMMGLHPTSVNENYEEELELVEREQAENNYIAVGEIGMDLYWDKSFREQQEDALRRQLKLAKKLRLPVSIHTRDAFDEIFKVVEDELTAELTGVFHCFTGTLDEAKKIIGTGFKLGIGGVVTFKNSKLPEVLKEVSTEHLILETDAPFLTPMPFRGKRNESAYLVYIAEKIAEIKGLAVEEVAEATTQNAFNVFNLNNR